MKTARKKKQRRLDSAAVERRFLASEKFVRHRQQTLIKEAEAANKKELLQLEAEALRATKEFDAKYSRTERPRPRLPVVTKEQLIALGGSPYYEKTPEKGKPLPPLAAIVFGWENEARMIFKPIGGGKWKVDFEGTPTLEDIRRELSKSGRGLWDPVEQKPGIAFQAVESLLSCYQFRGLPSDERQRATVHFTILTTLEALRQKQGRKLQIAFNLLTDNQWPQTLDSLGDHAWLLANELQRPPSKRELKDRFDAPTATHDHGKIHPSEFSKLLKHAGLAWLNRGRKKLKIG